ncbi:hypothetical protein IFM89_011397 [Coptis chinensis]|uniref:Transcription initiation factor IIE subunit alpha N-terminal domain-containing protein n=1 Tax=Coptis chinensis TaxID=261450 RepID=A0A835HZX5_9MAGN|nr:hypothetical protein IFM89_011397 [Coptis chinensis]
MKGDTQPKTGRSDNRGMTVVILDALTSDDFSLQTAKGAKIFSAAVAATADGQPLMKEGEEKLKLHTHSYCCLDYAQIYDVVRYRMHRMKKKLKDELGNRNTVQEYICPNCNRRYTALDALRLISPNDEYFHCENCDTVLVAASDKLAADEIGDGDDNARSRRLEKLKDILQKMDVHPNNSFICSFCSYEIMNDWCVCVCVTAVAFIFNFKVSGWKLLQVQLKPLMEQLARIKDLPAPEFGSLEAWEARASAAARANGDSGTNDPSKSSQGQGYGGTPLPYLGETKVEVALSGVKERMSNPTLELLL